MCVANLVLKEKFSSMYIVQNQMTILTAGGFSFNNKNMSSLV